MREYHVAVTGCDFEDGTKDHPFRTISRAALLAMPGDCVIVHEGEYREWVKPAQGGTSSVSRITYEAAEGERVVIKGSEQITCWEPVEVKTLTSSGMSAPARVPQVMIVARRSHSPAP